MKRFLRPLLRLLRTRNLLALTLILVLLYMIRNLMDIENSNNSIQQMLSRAKGDYFVPSSLKKIDWHNYKQIKNEEKRVGIGEKGKPARLSPAEAALEEKLYSVNGFNGALSDKIPLNRSLPDIRHPGCKKRLYIESLPTVSVVVPFHNEHWSTLLRTAFSVLYRSPDHLIKEVLLVDDASTKPFLKKELDDYLAQHMPRVRVVRLAARSGLITARLAGAKLATADVLIFLDSHTEANVNWLPPLLEPIALDHRVVVCPYIDVVAYDTFEYRAQDEGARGAFDWELFYKRLPVLPKDQANMPEPFESPVMAGGLFAISRAYFWELGGYDPGLDIWGGEQYELSFKIWQCGGRMVDAPCSRVGHIYRKFAPFPNPNHGDFVGKNYRRVAEVWMDEYAEHLYRRRPHYRDIHPGDIADQRELRRRLRCKPFRWFMTQVAFDLVGKYPPEVPQPYAQGRIRPFHEHGMCVDMLHGQQLDVVHLKPCGDGSAAEQTFHFTWHKDIKSMTRNMCWDLPNSAPKSSVVLYSCHLGGGNQLWRYRQEWKQIWHSSNTCLDYDATSHKLYVMPCDRNKETQQWTVDKVDGEQMAKWDEKQHWITGPVEQLEEFV